MKSYATMLSETKPVYFKRHADVWNMWRGGWGDLWKLPGGGNERNFNRCHSGCTQAVARYVAGDFDGVPLSPKLRNFVQTHGHSLNWTPGLTSYCTALVGVKGDSNALGDSMTYGLSPDEWEIIKLTFEAIVTIAIFVLFPPAGLIAGFLAEAAWIVLKFIIAAIICNMAIDVLSGAFGLGGADYSAQLDQWLAEAPAV